MQEIADWLKSSAFPSTLSALPRTELISRCSRGEPDRHAAALRSEAQTGDMRHFPPADTGSEGARLVAGFFDCRRLAIIHSASCCLLWMLSCARLLPEARHEQDAGFEAKPTLTIPKHR